MVKYTDILKAVNDKLTAKFPAIKIVSESDVEEKIIRPSFMTMLDGIKATDFMSVCADKEMTVRIYYFSKTEKNKLENLKMLESLEESFLVDGLIKAGDFNISVQDIDVNFPDKVLEFNMDISFVNIVTNILSSKF